MGLWGRVKGWLRGSKSNSVRGGKGREVLAVEKPVEGKRSAKGRRGGVEASKQSANTQSGSPVLGRVERRAVAAGEGKAERKGQAGWPGRPVGAEALGRRVAGEWESTAGLGRVWVHRETPEWQRMRTLGRGGRWRVEAVEQPKEAACFSHSPPDQSLRLYNRKRRAQFLRRFQRQFQSGLQAKVAQRLQAFQRLHAVSLRWPRLQASPRLQPRLHNQHSLPQTASHVHKPAQPASHHD
jgi:hypothetical protein